MFRLAGLLWAILVTGLSFGQGQETKVRQETVTVYIGEVVAMGGKIVERHIFATQEEGDKWEMDWKDAHPNSTKLTKVYPQKVPVSKTPSAKKQPEFARPQGAGLVPGGANPKKIIRVRTYKVIAGKMVEQKDKEQVFSTDDYDKASEFYWNVRSQQGYWAGWYDGQGRKPKIVGAKKPWVDVEGAYNKPKVNAPKAVDLVGTWTTKKWTTSEIDCTDTIVLKRDKSATWNRVSDYKGNKLSGRDLFTWSVDGNTIKLTKVSGSATPIRDISFRIQGGGIHEWTKK